MTYVKVCGIKTAKDALWALECGADALGFVFYRKSPRFIDPNSVRKITVKLPPDATTVGVFVNESAAFIRETLKITGIKIAQLHGEELPELLEAITAPTIKGIRIKNKSDLEQMKNYKPFAFLLDSKTDSYGGSGLSFDWGLAKKAKNNATQTILEQIMELLKDRVLSSQELVVLLDYSETEILNSLKILLEKNKITITKIIKKSKKNNNSPGILRTRAVFDPTIN